MSEGSPRCHRCSRVLGVNSPKVVMDNGVVYGADCYRVIQQRMNNLQYPLQEGDLEGFECSLCGRGFKAYKHNLQHQGSMVRCCFCCSRNSLRFKGQRCPFEIEIRERHSGR